VYHFLVHNIKYLKAGLLVIFLGGLALIYKTYNPLESHWFPKCPFLSLTGLQCPGCGSQRALHHLLNFHITEATRENLLLVLSIPYILTGLIFNLIKSTDPSFLQWRKRLFGPRAIMVVLVVILAFWVIRNSI